MFCAAEVRGVLLSFAEDPAIESRCHHRFHLQVRCELCSGSFGLPMAADLTGRLCMVLRTATLLEWQC